MKQLRHGSGDGPPQGPGFVGTTGEVASGWAPTAAPVSLCNSGTTARPDATLQDTQHSCTLKEILRVMLLEHRSVCRTVLTLFGILWRLQKNRCVHSRICKCKYIPICILRVCYSHSIAIWGPEKIEANSCVGWTQTPWPRRDKPWALWAWAPLCWVAWDGVSISVAWIFPSGQSPCLAQPQWAIRDNLDN